MSEMHLFVVDSTGIQPYIFGSNRLRENVGASHLVHLATAGWILTELEGMLPLRTNVAGGKIQPGAGKIEDSAIDAEVIYTGGGNSVVLFRDYKNLAKLQRALSARVLESAPGLEVVTATVSVDWSGSLAAAMDHAMSQLAIRKLQAQGSRPLQGLGVTAACRSTGMAANSVRREPGTDGNMIPISAEVAAKWNQADASKKRLSDAVLAGLSLEFEIPDQFEHLGRTAEDFSYIAVVHADGNHMGRKLQDITHHFSGKSGSENRSYIDALRTFSDAANLAGVNALKAVIEYVAEVNRRGVVAPSTERGVTYLSMRPIVFGGDDVTFVCDGRIGLQSAAKYLEAFARHSVPDANGSPQPCIAAAGVAIVKSRYPFARAYDLSSQLCSNAKQVSGRHYPALDFHLAQSGLFGSLREIRQSEYDEQWDGTTLLKSLLMRPLALNQDTPMSWHNWPTFVALHSVFKDKEQWPRNKTMKLRDALRWGPEAVTAFVTNYKSLNLPEIAINTTGYRLTGWEGNRCVYFDPIEMIEQEVLP